MTEIYKSILSSTLLLAFAFTSFCQNGIVYNSEEAQVGYVMVSHDFDTYLIDQCGEIVNEWSISNPDFHVKLDEDGNVYYIRNGKIYQRDWNDNIIAEIAHNIPELKLVYDVVKRSNGNFMVNCRWATNSTELSNLGWNSSIGSSNIIDGIVEINPLGEVVWEWHITDHTIQDEIQSASNFGSVKDNPQLMDIRAISDYDWTFGEAFMFNGFDYNEELDLILISVRKMSEFIIIDHSTTSEEAAGHSGGQYGKGGDILYRWGNPKNYNPTTIADRYLYYQHNPNWIKHGEHKDGIIVFNNGLSTFQGSSVIIVEPEVDANGQFMMTNGVFAPTDPSRIIDNNSFDNLSSGYTSGAKVMENGNVYITIGQWDQFIEVTTDDEIAWNYALPGQHYTYRTEKYSSTHPGLADKDLTPNGTIGNLISSYDCSIYTGNKNIEIEDDINFIVNQIDNTLSICPEFDDLYSMNLIDASGRLLSSKKNQEGQIEFDINGIGNQLIFVNIITENGRSLTRKLFVK